LLYTPRQLSSLYPLQEICQFHQILIPEKGPAGSNCHEWINQRHARPTGWNRAYAPLGVDIVHAVLTPVVAIAHTLKLLTEERMERMRYPEMFPRTITIGCS
jgi:hypothetical protein